MENTNIQLFTNELFGNVRVLNINGEPWFVGSDVAECLGYTDTNQAIRQHVYEEDKLTRQFNGSGQMRNMTIINESGLYSLILRSRMPAARQFQHWVTSEVLPSMRKIGFNNALQLLKEEVSRLQNENKDLHHQIEVFNTLCENKLIEIHF